MRIFITDLKGRTATTTDGEILGRIDNAVINLDNGTLMHLLIEPEKNLNKKKFEVDSKGRIVVPFKSFKSVKDVVVLELKE
ncbi:MAG: PRC-barrel domain-containing protein [Thermoplasmata archaeon]